MTDMKAVRIDAYGGPEQLKYEDVPRPQVQPSEILVRIHAAGINPVDYKVREGYMRDISPLSFPAILGYDIAGTVEAVGDGVSSFAPGDDVYADIDGGGYAEYVAVGAEHAARKPQTADFIQSAALPVAALTAWQALFDHAHLSAGQTVLIHAASGGVGHLAMQMAKDKGARVIATASGSSRDFVLGLGADQFIDYETQDFTQETHDVDVVLSTIPGDTQQRSWDVLKRGGILVSLVDPETDKQAQEHGKRGIMMRASKNGAQLAQIATLVDQGKLKPFIERTFPLSQARDAQELSAKGHIRGKVVLEVA